MIHTVNPKYALTFFRKYVGHCKIFERCYQSKCHKYLGININLYSPFLQIVPSISTFPVTLKAHTTKGWKNMAATGVKLNTKSDSDGIPTACEEGSDAILHSDLISEMQNCSSVSSQIEKFCSLISLSEEDARNRSLFCESLEDMLKLYFKNFKLHQFGSSVNGLGFKGCDVDVSLQTRFHNEVFIQDLKDVPTLEAVLDGSVSQEALNRLTPLFMLRFVRRILRRHGTDIREPIMLIKARIAILRFYNAKYNVFCDFACESDHSLQNTKVLRLICQLDERYVKLTKLVRYWGKYGGFVSDIDRFSSYSFSLVVIHFLQNMDPPVLPPIKEIIDKSNYLKTASVGDVSVMLEDLKNFKPSANSTPVEKLLRDFFFFYLKFDFQRVLLPYSGTNTHISQLVRLKDDSGEQFIFGTVNMQDPFRHSFNVTGSVTAKYALKFRNSLIQVCDTYQDSSNWVPKTEIWGLCSLLKPPIDDYKLAKELEQRLTHQIRLTMKPNAASKLKSIFEYGLLFDCKQFNVDTNSNVILNMRCRVLKNTCQGRDVVFHKYQNANDEVLKIEHMVSEEIVKNITEPKRKILVEFMCEVVEDTENEILVNMNFTGEKISGKSFVIAIFLKEYIPFIFNKM